MGAMVEISLKRFMVGSPQFEGLRMRRYTIEVVNPWTGSTGLLSGELGLESARIHLKNSWNHCQLAIQEGSPFTVAALGETSYELRTRRTGALVATYRLRTLEN